jgi:hypothetical protein
VHHRRERALHIGAAPPQDPIVRQLAAERVAGPALPRQDVDRIHVRVEQERRPVPAPLDRAHDVARLVGRHAIEPEPLHFLADARDHRLLVAEHAGSPDERSRELDE